MSTSSAGTAWAEVPRGAGVGALGSAAGLPAGFSSRVELGPATLRPGERATLPAAECATEGPAECATEGPAECATEGPTGSAPGASRGEARTVPCSASEPTSRADPETEAGAGSALASASEMRALARSSKNPGRSEEHTSELQSRFDLVCRLLR